MASGQLFIPQSTPLQASPETPETHYNITIVSLTWILTWLVMLDINVPRPGHVPLFDN
jgi:hypothetical protein